MKKYLIVLTAALSFGFAAAQTAPAAQVPTLTDVPAGHWAKDAIDRIVAKGIILGYPDGTFRGTQNLTRYEAAVIIARLLDLIAAGQVTTTTTTDNTGTTPVLSADDLAAVQNAVQELAADLAALGVRVSDLEANSVSQDDLSRLEARIEDVAAASGDPEAIATLTQQLEDFNTRADDLQANYDGLRADVDDNASSIAALNDLTVLLNNDILGLQDRVSAVETAQTDFVGRADFNALGGRVATVETNVTSLNNRVATLEKYAFSIKPTLSATYYVGRGTRDMDIDRVIPGTMFSTGTDGNGDTPDTPVDYTDLTGSKGTIGGLAGFSTATQVPVNVEGQTTVSFGITFSNSGTLGSGTSGTTGSYVPSKGGLNVNKLDVTFGVRAGLPAADARYPDVIQDDVTYRPLFFYFKNATANFTVGNNPVIVDFGRGQKFKFGDYVFDNDSTGRGDGFIVTVDGSNLPVIGAFKPVIKAVYGSKGGANGDNKYYRGIRAEITPVGTLKAGINVAQEGTDAFGAAGVPSDVTVFGADLHGTLAGFQLDSEFARSRVVNRTAGSGLQENTAFYVKTSGDVGPVKIYDLNFRAISPAYDAVAGIMEANPKDSGNGSTAPYAANQEGFGVKVATTLGPVSVGAYYDRQTAWAANFSSTSEPTLKIDRGVSAKVSLFNLVTIRGGYAEFLANGGATLSTAVPAGSNGQATRYNVRADITPGLGLSLGAYYRHLGMNGTSSTSQSDGKFFTNSKYGSYFPLTTNVYTDQSGCGDQHPGVATTDTDGVGGVLTAGRYDGTDTACYTEYGVELNHSGADAAALVKGLDFRVGYANRYRNATNSYSNNVLYGDIAYGSKLGAFNVNVEGAFSNSTFTATETNVVATTVANTTRGGFGIKIVSDPLDIIFKPSIEAQAGYYTSRYAAGVNAGPNATYNASGLKYLVGVKLNEFLLPNTKLAVYYGGLNVVNRAYTPFNPTSNAAGYFGDVNNGLTTNQNGLYFEANYYDLAFAYGIWNLSQKQGGVEQAAVNAANQPVAATGQTFKISYKVNF